ncbi:hypothetical protein LEP1GSC165_3922 [Leptospira santarosai str. CBC523]|nr:hypothetical protein LEP1GSC165_3922 [Leptospira santarosai str. CBC523]
MPDRYFKQRKVFLGWVLVNASIKNLSKKPEKKIGYNHFISS